MKPLVIPNGYKLQAKLETTPGIAFDYTINYTESGDGIFSEKLNIGNIDSMSYIDILDNTGTNNYVIGEITFYNKDTSDNTLYLAITDGTNTYEIGKVDIKSGTTIDLVNFIEANLTTTDGKVKADSTDTSAGYLSDKVDNSTIEVDTSNHKIRVKDGVYEPAFSKNTAFNKDFGTTAGTVAEGNHTHNDIGNVGTKQVDETNIADGKTIQYNATTDKYELVDFPAGGGGGGVETVKIAGVQVAGTYFFELLADSAKTIGNVVIALQTKPEGQDFIVKCYKNGTDLNKDITIPTTATAVNGRYKASSNVNESLVDDDVFELKIHQVGSTVAGSDFSCLVNIN